MVADACLSSLGAFSLLRHYVVFGRMLHRRFFGAPGWACLRQDHHDQQMFQRRNLRSRHNPK